MIIMILKYLCSNVPKNPPISPHPTYTPHLATEPYCFYSPVGQRSRLRGKHRFLIVLLTVLVDQKMEKLA